MTSLAAVPFRLFFLDGWLLKVGVGSTGERLRLSARSDVIIGYCSGSADGEGDMDELLPMEAAAAATAVTALATTSEISSDESRGI
jgi:hypothetical protein